MMIPDLDGDLSIGDRIDLQEPPEHCGFVMKVWQEAGGYRLVCLDDDYELSTDAHGVLTEPPYILDQF